MDGGVSVVVGLVVGDKGVVVVVVVVEEDVY